MRWRCIAARRRVRAGNLVRALNLLADMEVGVELGDHDLRGFAGGKWTHNHEL